MDKRTLLLSVLFILIASSFAGCRDASREVSGDIPTEALEAANFLNSGIITDSVVDVFREPDTKSERVTQAVFNQPVTILEEKDSWARVGAMDGSTGWIRSKFMDRDCSSLYANEFRYRIIITSREKKVLSNARGGITIKEVPMGTEFFSNVKIDGAFEAALPGKISGWVGESGTMQIAPGEGIPVTSPEDFVDTALKFKGTSFLTGGVSSRGMDSPGLVYVCGRINGVSMPREIDGQFRTGETVAVEDIQPGDLVFFHTKDNQENVAYVGIYIGTGKFIHADPFAGFVSTSDMEESRYKETLAGVRRIF